MFQTLNYHPPVFSISENGNFILLTKILGVIWTPLSYINLKCISKSYLLCLKNMYQKSNHFSPAHPPNLGLNISSFLSYIILIMPSLFFLLPEPLKNKSNHITFMLKSFQWMSILRKIVPKPPGRMCWGTARKPVWLKTVELLFGFTRTFLLEP